jgi:hypothetical protein
MKNNLSLPLMMAITMIETTKKSENFHIIEFEKCYNKREAKIKRQNKKKNKMQRLSRKKNRKK